MKNIRIVNSCRNCKHRLSDYMDGYGYCGFEAPPRPKYPDYNDESPEVEEQIKKAVEWEKQRALSFIPQICDAWEKT